MLSYLRAAVPAAERAWLVDYVAEAGAPRWVSRRLSGRQARSRTQTAVHLYGDPSGVLRPGSSRHILVSDRVIEGRSSTESTWRAGFATEYDFGVILALVADGVRGLAADPAEAELFFAPVAIRAPPLHSYSAADREAALAAGSANPALCPADASRPPEERARARQECLLTHAACARMYHAAEATRWRHLNASNERRHFLLVTTDSALGYCIENRTLTEGGEARLPRTALRLMWDGTANVHDGVVQMPCPSSIRWSASLDAYGLTPPWQSTHARPLLMSLVGSGNTPFKTELIAACRSLGPSVCGMIDSHNGDFPHSDHDASDDGDAGWGRGRFHGRDTLLRTLRLRRRSVFCLEPAGHSPGRKSQMDALLSGCIPVLFFSRRTYDAFLPLHFAWKDHASVRIDPAAVGAKTYSLARDLPAQLGRMNATGAARPLQRAIAKHARSLVYGLDGHYAGDASSTLARYLATALEAPPDVCKSMVAEWRCPSRPDVNADEGGHAR